jgi:Flp pilus assembly pilin Flp
MQRALNGDVWIQEVPMQRVRSIVGGQSGQTTAEYALVLLVAAVVVGVFAAFVKSGALTEMFQAVISSLVERAQG